MSNARLRNLKPERVLRALVRLGWNERATSSGRNPHKVMTKPGNPAHITIPFHKGKDVNPFLLVRQLKDAGVDLDEFVAALR